MKIIITPQESFFFKDARPFDKGNGWATGIFPPLPSTIYGALRSAAISQKSNISDFYSDRDIDIREEIGTVKKNGTLSIRSQVIEYKEMNFYITSPADILENESGSTLTLLHPLLPNNSEIITDIDLKLFKAANREFSKPQFPWISKYVLIEYLLGKENISSTSASLFVYEPKTGIQKNGRRGTAQEHMLYVQNMLRMNNGVCFSVDVENCSSLEEKGILKLGHDGRVFSYQCLDEGNFDYIDDTVKQQIKSKIAGSGYFKLVFTSPALLANGWLPGGAVKEKGGYKWHVNDRLTIIIESVVIDRAVRIGGWKLNKKGRGKPKAMYKALPPGTVYYCRFSEGGVDELFDTFFDKNFSDIDDSIAKQGFGHMLVASINQ